ncbi:hypothetical protein CYMTET_18391, partial [Cymbomonas tetramitiformis]
FLSAPIGHLNFTLKTLQPPEGTAETVDALQNSSATSTTCMPISATVPEEMGPLGGCTGPCTTGSTQVMWRGVDMVAASSDCASPPDGSPPLVAGPYQEHVECTDSSAPDTEWDQVVRWLLIVVGGAAVVLAVIGMWAYRRHRIKRDLRRAERRARRRQREKEKRELSRSLMRADMEAQQTQRYQQPMQEMVPMRPHNAPGEKPRSILRTSESRLTAAAAEAAATFSPDKVHIPVHTPREDEEDFDPGTATFSTSNPLQPTFGSLTRATTLADSDLGQPSNRLPPLRPPTVKPPDMPPASSSPLITTENPIQPDASPQMPSPGASTASAEDDSVNPGRGKREKHWSTTNPLQAFRKSMKKKVGIEGAIGEDGSSAASTPESGGKLFMTENPLPRNSSMASSSPLSSVPPPPGAPTGLARRVAGSLSPIQISNTSIHTTTTDQQFVSSVLAEHLVPDAPEAPDLQYATNNPLTVPDPLLSPNSPVSE